MKFSSRNIQVEVITNHYSMSIDEANEVSIVSLQPTCQIIPQLEYKLKLTGIHD